MLTYLQMGCLPISWLLHGAHVLVRGVVIFESLSDQLSSQISQALFTLKKT
jgi:hypothetical protein